MTTKVHVANLADGMTERERQVLFSPHGNVAQINLPVEHPSGRSRGFAIVTMATSQGVRVRIWFQSSPAKTHEGCRED